MGLKSLWHRAKDNLEAEPYKLWLVAAGAFSLLMGAIVYCLIPNVPAQTAIQPMMENRGVVVARVDIPERTIIDASMLEVVGYPASLAPIGAYGNSDGVVGAMASVPIQAGDVVTDRKIGGKLREEGFIGSIPDNMRAISVKISDEGGVSGFARPGDHVDILLIRGKDNLTMASGELLLQNVLLLAINRVGLGEKQADGNQSAQSNGGGFAGTIQPNISSLGVNESLATATVALTPDDALKLAVNAQSGTLYMALRPSSPSNEFVEEEEYSIPNREALLLRAREANRSPRVGGTSNE